MMKTNLPKKMLALGLALVLALGAGLACGEAAANLTVPRMGTMEDTVTGRITAELYPAALTGTGYVNELSLDIHWPDASGNSVNYYLILEPASDDGAAAEYLVKGDIVHLICGKDGEITEEKWENRQIGGTAVFAANENGVTELSFHDDANEDLNDLKLHLSETPAPAAEDVAANVLRPIFELEEESAGANMKAASAAADLIAYAAANGFYAVNQEKLAAVMQEAAASLQLTKEEFNILKTNAARAAQKIRDAAGLTVMDPEEYEEVLKEMEDAGAGEVLREALKGFTEACSAGVMAERLEALEYTAK